jgi:hypothetical protein
VLSSRGIEVLPDRVTSIKIYPRPTTLRTLRFLGMVGFYARFIPELSRKVAVLHVLKKKVLGSTGGMSTSRHSSF